MVLYKGSGRKEKNHKGSLPKTNTEPSCNSDVKQQRRVVGVSLFGNSTKKLSKKRVTVLGFPFKVVLSNTIWNF